MRVAMCAVVALLVFGQQQDDRGRLQPRMPSPRPGQVNRTNKNKSTNYQPAGNGSVDPNPPQRYHGHPIEGARGTPPCGTPDSNCPPPPLPPEGDNHATGIGVGLGVGIFAGVLVGSLAHAPEPVNKLSNNGPQFGDTVHMSAFQVTGFVKGGWPLVIDYESIVPAYAVLTVVTQNAPTSSFVLPTDQTARRNVLVQLPTTLGTDLKIANYTIRSTVSDTDLTPRYFRVYGIGCGPKAVGSVAIDQLKFSPQIITAAQSDTRFSFHTHANFDRVKAEFMQVSLVDHCLEGQIFDNKKIDKRFAEGDYWNDTWNGRNARPGQIQFRVRGWMTAASGGDWVSAFSPDLVSKQ